MNRYAVQAVDSGEERRTWIVWDRLRQRATDEGDTREEMRKALREKQQERIELKEGDIP